MEAESLLIKTFTETDRLTILAGAGISMPPPTSIPTVLKFYKSIMEAARMDSGIQDAVLNRLKTMRPQPRFEVFVYEFQRLIDRDLKFTKIFDVQAHNSVHQFAACLLNRGALAITTNFDRCIELAGLPEWKVAAYDGLDLPVVAVDKSLLKPHGTVTSDNRALVVTDEALSRTNNGFTLLPNWRLSLLAAIHNRTLLVIGYSGSAIPGLDHSGPVKRHLPAYFR